GSEGEVLIDPGDSSKTVTLSGEAVGDINTSSNFFAIGLSFLRPASPTETVLFDSATLTIDGTIYEAISQGNFSQAGAYDQTALIGLVDDIDYNAFFLFDISDLTATVSSVILSLDYQNDGVTLGFQIYDVLTSSEEYLSPVPVPTSLFLLSFGLISLAASRKKY
ncbi:MAG: PEP-CTERM sorting domain-containing protein, partial [Desulfobacterales bacterium]|nr:PEP-CTERM sorting domain-containing protein [Desulfobacterales bacterium]